MIVATLERSMVPPAPMDPPVTHQDLYWRIGEISGKIDALTVASQHQSTEVAALGARVVAVEKLAAIVITFATLASLTVPVAVTFALNRFFPAVTHNELTPAEEAQLKHELENRRVLENRRP